MSHYKPYPAYKDSGVEWLGQVPEHWRVMAIKNIVSTPITDGPHETPEFLDEGVPFVSAEAVSSGKIDFEKVRGFISREDHRRYSQKYCPRRGDIFMVKSGATTGVTAIVETDDEFNIWSPLAVIRCGKESDPYFILNFMRSRSFQEAVALSWSYGTQQNIGMGVISNLAATVPPQEEQRAIAARLDRETARIDALVAKKTYFIELLREKRQALITHAVTKGIDPNVRMKDSGVEWLGEVPEHWVVSPVRYAVKPQAGAIKTGPFGSQLTANEMLGGSFKVYNQKNVIEGDLSSGDNYISDEKFAQLSSFRVLPGDVLVTTRGTIGRVCVVPDEIEPGILHPCLMRVQVDEAKMEKEFFAALLGDSQILQSQISYLSNASTIEVIYSETMGSLVVPIPPLSEQRSILEFIQTHASKLGSLIQTSERSINLLKERRSALITAAVTGQIDLREAV